MEMLNLPRRYKSIDSLLDSPKVARNSRMKEFFDDDSFITSKVLGQLSRIYMYHPRAFVSTSKKKRRSLDIKKNVKINDTAKSKKPQYIARLFP